MIRNFQYTKKLEHFKSYLKYNCQSKTLFDCQFPVIFNKIK